VFYKCTYSSALAKKRACSYKFTAAVKQPATQESLFDHVSVFGFSLISGAAVMFKIFFIVYW